MTSPIFGITSGLKARPRSKSGSANFNFLSPSVFKIAQIWLHILISWAKSCMTRDNACRWLHWWRLSRASKTALYKHVYRSKLLFHFQSWISPEAFDRLQWYLHKYNTLIWYVDDKIVEVIDQRSRSWPISTVSTAKWLYLSQFFEFWHETKTEMCGS